MNMSTKNIPIRIIMDLIILKILKQHPLVLQHSTTEIESTEKNIQTSHATDMTTAKSSKHYLR